MEEWKLNNKTTDHYENKHSVHGLLKHQRSWKMKNDEMKMKNDLFNNTVGLTILRLTSPFKCKNTCARGGRSPLTCLHLCLCLCLITYLFNNVLWQTLLCCEFFQETLIFIQVSLYLQVLTICMYHAINRVWYMHNGTGREPMIYLTLTTLLLTLLAIGMAVGVVLAVGVLLYLQVSPF